MKLRRTISTILIIVLFSSVSLFMGCSDDDDSQPASFDYSQLYAEKLIIDDGALELEGDFTELISQMQASENLAIKESGTSIMGVGIRGLLSDVHTVEVVKSLDTHHVEIETEDGDGFYNSLMRVKIFLTADDERHITYNLYFYSIGPANIITRFHKIVIRS
ncbi:MAG: hypothetical protein GY795_27080 [Desulfobacterales bacterium]|nr:hypothetical protein [Desulfobacterales bacterium]